MRPRMAWTSGRWLRRTRSASSSVVVLLRLGRARRRTGAGGARQARRGPARRAAVGPRREGLQLRDRGRTEAAARAVRGALAPAHLPPDVRRGLGGGVPG